MHSSRKNFLVGLILCASIVQADEDCTFNSQAILENVDRSAKRFPGASVDSEKIRATWVYENGDSEYYSEGGCYDLGGAAGRVSQMSERRSSDSVRQVVIELAQRYLPDSEAKRISRAFENGSYETHASDSAEFVFIRHPIGAIIITHRFADGFDTVEVAWPIL